MIHAAKAQDRIRESNYFVDEMNANDLPVEEGGAGGGLETPPAGAGTTTGAGGQGEGSENFADAADDISTGSSTLRYRTPKPKYGGLVTQDNGK